MKKTLVFLFSLLCVQAAAAKSYPYESVADDPLHAQIYTLPNGLKVYLSVNKEQPRIQTYIAVRAGGKNDPAETTGLAHYLEHLMFKGTPYFGTTDYAAERPLLDSITNLYETYRHTTDETLRKAIYHQIDSISYCASKIAIANEYDKLMATIGANGTNAYTWYDITCYEEDIPSNEIDNWARVQADRFQHMVIRGFHTELESVYEEKNISMGSDEDKLIDGTMELLFPHHPYGTQTVIGTQDHLKNPSIVNILDYYHQYYVPNNVAICMSGDFNPDEVMTILEKHFGDWKPAASFPKLNIGQEIAITSPRTKEAFGLESEQLMMGWRLPGSKSHEAELLTVAAYILSNGQAGLLDLDINQQQLANGVGLEALPLADYSALLAYGTPKEGQTLEELRDLILKEIQKLADGDWDASLLNAVKNNIKLEKQEELESNEARATIFVNAFINQIPWEQQVHRMDRIMAITKEDICKFAKKWIDTNKYAAVFKRQGKDPNERKIEKPEISPIEMNRDQTSDFVREVQETKVAPIAPVFLDYNKDLSVACGNKGSKLVYKHNDTNDLFTLNYIFPTGYKAQPALRFATNYFEYLGTKKKDAEELQSELYRMACSVSFDSSESQTTITISGLEENREAAVALVREWVKKARVDNEAYEDYVSYITTNRANSKLDQKRCFAALLNYGIFGEESVKTLSNEELANYSPKVMVKMVQEATRLPELVVYYGPAALTDISTFYGQHNWTRADASTFELPIPDNYSYITSPQTEVIIASYDAKNVYMRMYSNEGKVFDASSYPALAMYDTYFGDNMSSIVFQEMRESRGLAYSAGATHLVPANRTDGVSFNANIITQNDKLNEAVTVFRDIIENMPQSETAFPLGKEALMKRLSTERTLRTGVLNNYITARSRGLDHDMNRDLYEQCGSMTLQDVVNYQQSEVKGHTYKILILGDPSDLDMDFLRTLGPVKQVTLDEIFGY